MSEAERDPQIETLDRIIAELNSQARRIEQMAQRLADLEAKQKRQDFRVVEGLPTETKTAS